MKEGVKPIAAISKLLHVAESGHGGPEVLPSSVSY